MKILKGVRRKLQRFLGPPSKPVAAIADPDLPAATHSDSSPTLNAPLLDTLDVTIDTSINTIKGLKEIAEAIPTIGGSLKATCGVMVLVLENIKRCKENRERWRELAEIMEEKNQRVISLLGLYAQSPQKYTNALEQVNRYQRILNMIATDMKMETQDNSDACERLERYWERTKQLRKEAALSGIKAEKIMNYKEQLRDQALNVAEAVGIQNAIDLNRNIMTLEEIRSLLTENVQVKTASFSKVALRPRPPLVEGFVGRDDILRAMRQIHFDDTSSTRQAPLITVLTGLGGSGKTQISLKFASEFEQRYLRYEGSPVYFLDASSREALRSDLQTLPQSQMDEYTDALIWLAKERENWLIIMDNADDPSVKLARFIPRCSHGHVIITTRNYHRKTLSPKSTHIVDSLQPEDAISLLLNASGYEDNDKNRRIAGKIVQELGCLPLAVAHSGAYILIRQCLDTYLKTYRNSRKQLLARQVDLAHDYPYSVATTIEMSLDRLPSQVKDLLGLLSHFGSASIPHCIIERAASKQFQHVAFKTSLPLHDDTLRYVDTLMSIICPQGAWNQFDFDNMIEDCERYSLLRLSTVDGEKFYSMHILVKNFIQSTYRSMRNGPLGQLVIRLLGSTIYIPADRSKFFASTRILVPFIRHIDPEDVIEAGDLYGFGRVLEGVREGQLAASHMERCTNIWANSLGNEAGPTLRAMERLARAYVISGKGEESLKLREQILATRRKVLGEDNPYTLSAMSNLAASYSQLERYTEALALNKAILERGREVLGKDLLYAMCNLARSYSYLGRHEEALPLNEEVLEKRRISLGDQHRETVRAMKHLAVSYSGLKRYEEALALDEEVLKKRRDIFGEDHFETVRAMENLARSYWHVARYEEALALDEEIVEKWTKTLGSEHSHTLAARQNLVCSYFSLGIPLKDFSFNERAVKKRVRILGEGCLDTLTVVTFNSSLFLG
ncbi:hypothetical protein CPB86DRAFT_830534 [Serendipita vermifera]|nr:hypothetical protein CPB86DRAFT_830534 [Serendipita vermifera]